MSRQASKRRKLEAPTKQSKLHNFFKKPSGSTQDLLSQLSQCSQSQGSSSQTLFQGSSSHTASQDRGSSQISQNMIRKGLSSAEDNPFSPKAHRRTIITSKENSYEKKSKAHDEYLPTDYFGSETDSPVKILGITDISSTKEPEITFVELDSADCFTPQEESLAIQIKQMPSFKIQSRDDASDLSEKADASPNELDSQECYTPIMHSVSIPIRRVNPDLIKDPRKAQNPAKVDYHLDTLEELDSQLDCCTPSEYSVAILPAVKRGVLSLEELDSQFDCFTPAEQSQSIRLQQLPEMPFESDKLDNTRSCKVENKEDSQNQRNQTNDEESPAPEESTIPADIAAMFTLGDTYIQNVTRGIEQDLREEIESADILTSTLMDCGTGIPDSLTSTLTDCGTDSGPRTSDSPRVIPDSYASASSLGAGGEEDNDSDATLCEDEEEGSQKFLSEENSQSLNIAAENSQSLPLSDEDSQSFPDEDSQSLCLSEYSLMKGPDSVLHGS